VTKRGQRADLLARKRLPAGRHGLPGDVVRDHQRRRLYAAIAECCRAPGYADSSIHEIISRASVSKKTFYELFDDKQSCLLASYADYRERLLATVEEGCSEEDRWPQRARGAIRGALRFLAADLAGAELLTTSVLCTGSQGARRYYETVDLFAARLRESAPTISASHPHAEWGVTVAIGAMIGQAANAGEREAVLRLEDDLSAMLLGVTGVAR
jgi:AcrR family transcriptional regulator